MDDLGATVALESPRLDATRFHPVLVVAEIGSTNATLLDRARAGAPEGLVLAADHQVAGRGRMGRTWEDSPRRSMLVSVLLRPQVPPEDLGLVPTVAALALGDACLELTGLRPDCKWPNDLLVGDRKLAGVLTELAWPGPAAVVGVGCNLSGSLDPALAPAAVTLAEVSGTEVARDDLLVEWLVALEPRYERLGSVDGREAEAAEYRRRCTTLGQEVRVELAGGRTLVGRATSIARDGRLEVVEASGSTQLLAAGDVVHLRPGQAPAGA